MNNYNDEGNMKREELNDVVDYYNSISSKKIKGTLTLAQKLSAEKEEYFRTKHDVEILKKEKQYILRTMDSDQKNDRYLKKVSQNTKNIPKFSVFVFNSLRFSIYK